MRRTVSWALAIAAVAWAAWATAGLWADVARHSARIVDFLPLWLGGRALLYRLDPTDPMVLRAVYESADLPMRPGGFQSYYPQSAAMVFSPLGYLDYAAMARWLQGALGVSLLAGTAAGAVAQARPRITALAAITALALGVGVAASLKISWIMLNIGQSNTILVLLTGLGIWALARDRTGLGGLAIGLGIAIKLFPVVLLVPAILARRWRLVGIAVAVPVVIFLASLLLYSGPWGGSPLGIGASWFVDAGIHPGWAQYELPVVLCLWHGRFWGPGLLTAGLTVWAARRPSPAVIPALAALWVAWVGTVMAGSAMPHQAIVILPALGWLIAWPLAARKTWLMVAALALLIAVAWWRGIFFEHRAGSLQWLPVCFAIVVGCSARVVETLRRSPEGPSVSPGSTPSGPTPVYGR